MALSTRSKKTTPALPTQETPVVTLEDGDRESTLSAPTSLEEQIINAREEHERLLKEQELQTLKESNEQLRKQAATGVAIESSITTTSRSSSVSHKRSASGSPHGRDSRHEIRPKNLDPYYGKNLKDHREFVYSAEQAFRMSPSYFPTEERKILWAFQSIKGKIRDAWRAWEAELLHPELVTWEEFADFLLNQVSDPLNRKLDAATAYAKAEQRAGQSIREFSVYLETLEAQIPWYTEEQKIQHLFARLREELQVAITNLYRIPDTKEDLVRLGTTLEDNLRKTAKAHGNHLRSAARGGSPRYNRGRGSTYSGARGAKTVTTTRETHLERTQQSRPPLRLLSEMECFNCHRMGHLASHCPDPRNKSDANATVLNTGKGRALHQSRGS